MIFPNIKRNDIWQKGHNTLAEIVTYNTTIEIKNIRNMDHISQEEHYENQKFDLNSLSKLNFISVPFGYKNMLSHVMLEYIFENNKKVVLSIEARRKPNEKFSILKGLFFGFGIIYIWGTPGDLIGLREEIRKDKVYKFEMLLSKEQIQKSFLFFSNQTNQLLSKPRYYNSIFSNCTTNLWDAFSIMKNSPRKNFSVIFNGKIHLYLQKLGYLKSYE